MKIKNIFKFACTYVFLVVANSAQAALITDGVGVFDDANDLLRLGGTIQSSNVAVDGILFDWDGLLDGFDHSGTALVSSNIGGSLSTPAPGFNSGSLLVAGFSGGTLALPVSFDFVFSIPNAGAQFTSTPIDFYTCQNCLAGSISYDFTNMAFLTPTSGSVAAVPEPSVVALFGAGIFAFGVLRRKKRKVI